MLTDALVAAWSPGLETEASTDTIVETQTIHHHPQNWRGLQYKI